MTAAQARPQIVSAQPAEPHKAIGYVKGMFREDDFIFLLGIHAWKTHPNKKGVPVADVKTYPLMPLFVAAAEKTMAQLQRDQSKDWNIYISMNPFPQGTTSRTESLITTIRNCFIETDGGPDVLKAISIDVSDGIIPAPHSILQSSPGKYHIVWHVDGIAPDEAKALNRALASRYGGDQACTDLHRVLRMPGFRNLKPKYVDKPVCELVEPMLDEPPYTRDRFKLETVVLKADSAPVSEGVLANVIAALEQNAEEARVILGTREKDLHGYRWDIVCPWAETHTYGGKDAILMVLKNGHIEFSCLHNHCEKRGWSDVRAQWEQTVGHKQKFASTKELQELILSKDGTVKAIVANAIKMLTDHPAWQGVLAYNELTLFPVKLKPTPWGTVGDWSDYDDVKLSEWFQRQGLFIDSSKKAGEAAQAVAQMNRFHPVRDYLNSVKWDGVARLDAWLTTYLGVNVGKDVGEDVRKYVHAVGPCWMISAVARALERGCKVDYLLLLQSGQGRKKSQALEALAGKEFFSDHMPDLGNKDALLEAHRVWIVELAELASIRGKENERVKAFLTRANDFFRAPYDRRVQEHPRGFAFAGTTNDDTPFTDESGNRRYWPVKCGAIDIKKLRKDRDQLWAEAVTRYKNGEHWWLDAEIENTAEKEQHERYQTGAWDDLIEPWIENPVQAMKGEWNQAAKTTIEVAVEPFTSKKGEVTVSDVLRHAVKKPEDRWTQPDKNAVVRCLKHNGWVQRLIRDGAKVVRVYRKERL